MKQIAKILVVADGKYDRQAMVAEVSSLVGESATQVTLLGVTEPPPADSKTWSAISNLYEWTLNEQFEELTRLYKQLEQAGISANILQAVGKSHEQVIRASVSGSFDLIMKPATDDGGKPKFLFGSTDMQLFRLSPVPVWIFKPGPANRLARVMVAVDLLAYDDVKSALAAKVLAWGKYVAAAAGAELHVLHTWDLYRELTLRSHFGPKITDGLSHAVEQRARQWLDEAIAHNGLDDGKITIHFLKGIAEDLIPSISQSQKIDLLVMGSVGRTGVPGFFIGNTADSVLRQVNCSVLAIKPDGFLSPIRIENPEHISRT